MILDGRGDHVIGMNLRCALDKSCQRLQHLLIGNGVVVVGIFLVVPHTDRKHVNSARAGESDFVLKPILLAQQGQDVLFEGSRVIGQIIRFQMKSDIT